MGMGPAPATRKALERAGLSLDDIDLFEVNEAFAGQYLAVEKELGLDRDKVNVNGGAIALGHPLGMPAAPRLLLTRHRSSCGAAARSYGLATACIGGGQGIAAIVEALPDRMPVECETQQIRPNDASEASAVSVRVHGDPDR